MEGDNMITNSLFKWKFVDSNRTVKVMSTLRAIKNEEETIVRFKNIDKLPDKLQNQISLLKHDMITAVPDLKYIKTVDSKIIKLQNENGNISLFNSDILRHLCIDREIDISRCQIYIKDNNSPLVTYCKGYYYMVFPMKYEDMTVANMIEHGMISVC
jgi:hypothetical protein